MAQFVDIGTHIINLDQVRCVEPQPGANNKVKVCLQGHDPFFIEGDAAALLLDQMHPAHGKQNKELAKEFPPQKK